MFLITNRYNLYKHYAINACNNTRCISRYTLHNLVTATHLLISVMVLTVCVPTYKLLTLQNTINRNNYNINIFVTLGSTISTDYVCKIKLTSSLT